MERVAARVCASLGEVPVPLRQLWNPWTCRSDLLPYLAWAFSVDRWDEAWPISTKRKAVADAFYLHKYKGTTGAMRRVVEPFGFFILLALFYTGVIGGLILPIIRFANNLLLG